MIVHCQRPVALEREQCQCHIFNIYWPVYRWEINRFFCPSEIVPRLFSPCILPLFVARQKLLPPLNNKKPTYFCTHVVIISHTPTTDTLNHSYVPKIATIHSDTYVEYCLNTISLFCCPSVIFTMHFRNSLFLFWFLFISSIRLSCWTVPKHKCIQVQCLV